MKDEGLMTLAEVAAYCKVKLATVHHWTSTGALNKQNGLTYIGAGKRGTPRVDRALFERKFLRTPSRARKRAEAFERFDNEIPELH